MKISMNSTRNYVLLISLLAPVTLSQAANLYKWTDEEGVVHYTQSPPTKRPSKVMRPEQTRSSEPAGGEEDVKNVEPSPVPEDAPPLAKTAEARSEQETQVQQNDCQKAQNDLAFYQSSGKVVQPGGTETVLSPEMREAKLREIMQQITAHCQ